MTDIYTIQLVESLKKANEAYRLGSPMISDAEYDAMLDELKSVDPENPWLHNVEPEPAASAKKSGRTVVKHPAPMLSVQKVKSYRDMANIWWRAVGKFESGINAGSPVINLMPKLDGMAATNYSGLIVSRGDGAEGHDISHIVNLGVIVPPDYKTTKFAGEIVVDSCYFDNYLSDEFAHPRNFVTGLVNAKKIKNVHKQALTAGAVRLINFDFYLHKATILNPSDNYDEWILQIGSSNYHLVKYSIGQIVQMLLQYAGEMYPTDGLVLTIPGYAEILGKTDHHWKHQVAIKPVPIEVESEITDIFWQLSKEGSGTLTPVAAIRPVVINGVTISKVTLHNLRFVQENQCGVWSKVKIIRAGDVIPKVQKVISSGNVIIPETCAVCGHKLSSDNTKLFCTNKCV